jgi:hypothetical protein
MRHAGFGATFYADGSIYTGEYAHDRCHGKD